MGLLSGIFGKKRTDPVTGEQHRTGLRKAFHGLHNVERAVRPVAKHLIPAAIGTGLPFLLPAIGRSMGVDPSGGMGRALMMNGGDNASPMNQLLNIGKGATLRNPNQNAAAAEGEASGNGFLSGMSGKDLLDFALLGMTVAGKLGARSKYPHQPSIADTIQANRPHWGPEHQPRPHKKLNRRYVQPPANYRPGFDPEWDFFEETEEPAQFARGGYIKKSASGGQADDIPMELPHGAYVWNATDLSLLGDGYSENGAQKLKELEDNFLKSGIINTKRFPLRHGPGIKAKVSNGEYVMRPEIVTVIGSGDNQKGAKLIDKAREKLRKQKGVKKILPPKTKPISHYFEGR